VPGSGVKLSAETSPPTTTLPDTFTLGVRPEDIDIIPDGEFSGVVGLIEPLGVETVVHIQSDEQTLISLVPGVANVKYGDNIQFDIVRDRLHYFDSEGKRI
jgi:ABC-type sugar transport system ATPase subunit